MDLDLELGTKDFIPANSRLWYLASPGQEIEKKTLFHQQVVNRFCLATRDLEILQKNSVAEFCFRQSSNKSLLLASQHLVLIWNSYACYVSYDDIQSKRFQDFMIATKAWVSNGLPFDNSLVIRAALHLIYEEVQDRVHKLKSGVEDSWYLLRDLGEKGSILSSKSKNIMVEIFDSRSPGEIGGVTVFLESNQLQEYKKAWDNILEQLDSIRALLNTKLQKLKIILVLRFVLSLVIFGGGLLYIVLMVVVSKPRSLSSAAICVSGTLSLVGMVHMQLRGIKYRVRMIWLA